MLQASLKKQCANIMYMYICDLPVTRRRAAPPSLITCQLTVQCSLHGVVTCCAQLALANSAQLASCMYTVYSDQARSRNDVTSTKNKPVGQLVHAVSTSIVDTSQPARSALSRWRARPSHGSHCTVRTRVLVSAGSCPDKISLRCCASGNLPNWSREDGGDACPANVVVIPVRST